MNNKEEVTVKMKDIRAKETKLRKWEEDLKVKEKALQEKGKSQTYTDTYIATLEARNKELEQTVRILKRRISMLEESKDQRGDETHKSETRQQNRPEERKSVLLLEKLHGKVTNFILDSMDKQLERP